MPPQTTGLPHLELWQRDNQRNYQNTKPLLSNASFLDPQTDQTTDQNTKQFNSVLLLGHWSPDDHWLTLHHYPKISREIYLWEISSNTMTRIPTAEESWGIRVIGWIE